VQRRRRRRVSGCSSAPVGKNIAHGPGTHCSLACSLRKQLPRAERVGALRRPHEQGGRLAEASQLRVRLHNAAVECIGSGAQAQHRNRAACPSPRDFGAKQPL